MYAHVYHEHFDLIGELKAVEHLNTSFKHFILFVQEFKMMEQKQLAPLQELIQAFAPSQSASTNGHDA